MNNKQSRDESEDERDDEDSKGAANLGLGLPVRLEKAHSDDQDLKVPATAELKDVAASATLAELDGGVADTSASDSWESDSLLEDAIEALFEDPGQTNDDPDPDRCTPEESARLRRELREIGPAVFCQRTVDAGRYTAKKLLTAFGIRPPAFLDGQDDEAYFGLLSIAISRELSKRTKLSEYNTVNDVVRLIHKCDNIIVVTGAGISTSLGIPDFRSKGTGLYSKLEHLGLADPQEVFDINVFKEDPTIFYSIAKDIIPDTDRYTPTHKFIAMLHSRGKLLTNYSQNIDNLEVKAGLPSDKLIQCHGSFGTATCVLCGHQVVGETIFPDVKAGKIPRCSRCAQNMAQNTGRPAKRKRAGGDKKRRRRSDEDSSDDDSEYDLPTVGVMKPDITFFGEQLPDAFSRRLTENDRDKVDLVLVIGTSLKVAPVSEIVNFLPSQIPQVYISREAVSHINFDIDLLGDCDVIVAELCRQLEWTMEHEMVPKNQEVNVRAEEGHTSRHIFKVQEPSAQP